MKTVVKEQIEKLEV